MTTLKELTVEEAPREFASLAKLGKFQLRHLASKLGMLEDETSKMNFITSPQESQAQAVCEALKEFDKRGGGVPTTTAAPAEKPKRTPKTSDDKPAAPAGGASVDLSEVTKAIEESEKRVLAAIEGLRRAVDVSMSLTLIAAEQNLGAGRDEILGQAIEDLGIVQKLLNAKKK